MKRAIVLFSVIVLMASPVHAGTDPGDACLDVKARATGKKVASVLKAFGKNTKKSNPTKLGQEVSKAQSKFTRSFSKMESKGDCWTRDDADTIAARVDALVGEVIAEVSCGDGFLGAGEQCDDGNRDAGDGCDGKCRIEEMAEGANTATTDNEGPGGTPDGTFPDDSTETTVMSPLPGTITIVETSTTVVAPPGFELHETQVDVEITGGTTPTALDPYVLIFELDASLGSVLTSVALELIDVFQYNPSFPDGRLVASCTGDGATPDPCVRRFKDPATGDVTLTVFTTTASTWVFGVPLAPPGTTTTTTLPPLPTTTTVTTTTTTVTTTTVTTTTTLPCVPNCAGLECGDDGCGGSCGTCSIGEVCHPPSGTCVVS